MKKGFSFFVALPIGLTCLSACAASLSRSEAYRVLDAICTKTNVNDFQKPDSFSVDTITKTETVSTAISCTYSATKHYYHYKSSTTIASSVSGASSTQSEESWFYIDSYSTFPIIISYVTENDAEVSLSTTGFNDLGDAILEWSTQTTQSEIKTQISSYYSDLNGVPTSLKNVLSSLGSTGINEVYSSTGNGYLDFSVKDSSQSYSASFKNYLVSENDISDDASSTKRSYYWNNAKIYYPVLSNSSSSSVSVSSIASSAMQS